MTRQCIGCGRVKNSNRILSARLRSLALKHLPEAKAFPFRNGKNVCQLPPAEELATRDKNELYVCQKLIKYLNQFMKQYDGDDGDEQQHVRRRRYLPPPEHEAIPALPPLEERSPTRALARAPLPSQPEMAAGNSAHTQNPQGAEDMQASGALLVPESDSELPSNVEWNKGNTQLDEMVSETDQEENPEPEDNGTQQNMVVAKTANDLFLISTNKHKRPCLGCGRLMTSNRPMSHRIYVACTEFVPKGRVFIFGNGQVCTLPEATELSRPGTPGSFVCMRFYKRLEKVAIEYDRYRTSLPLKRGLKATSESTREQHRKSSKGPPIDRYRRRSPAPPNVHRRGAMKKPRKGPMRERKRVTTPESLRQNVSNRGPRQKRTRTPTFGGAQKFPDGALPQGEYDGWWDPENGDFGELPRSINFWDGKGARPPAYCVDGNEELGAMPGLGLGGRREDMEKFQEIGNRLRGTIDGMERMSRDIGVLFKDYEALAVQAFGDK